MTSTYGFRLFHYWYGSLITEFLLSNFEFETDLFLEEQTLIQTNEKFKFYSKPILSMPFKFKWSLKNLLIIHNTKVDI